MDCDSQTMGEPGRDATVQLSSGVSVTIVKVMCGSPAGMGQLMKYFESQSRRLDRQMFQTCPSSLNPAFESAIKFNGVPILPPAITSSRRDELRQFKKDAVLLEKRLKTRHRQELLSKADSLVKQSQVYFPDTSLRQAARQLNFDSGAHDESTTCVHDRLIVADPYSTLSAIATGNDLEGFGLQTMDSVNSDFMSLDYDSIPRVFSGLVLTSVKEQKISYDLDRLSKALNVQDLTSTSSSDLSDAMSCTQDRKDLQNVKNMENLDKAHCLDICSALRVKNESDALSANSFHDNQDMMVTTSIELGKITSVGNTGTSRIVENTKLKNVEQTANSLGSTPTGGSANTSIVPEGQWSNKSSPKSLKSGVHFASFVTEYVNTGASQSLEHPTVVKKKLSSEHGVTEMNDPVISVIGDVSESHRKHLISHKVSDSENGGALLDNVSFCLDSDSSPVTPPFNKTGNMPFQGQGQSETYSSDKENDVSQAYKNLPQEYKRSPELGNRLGQHNSDDKGNSEPHACDQRQHINNGDEKNCKSKNGTENKNSLSPRTRSIPQTLSSSLLRGIDAYQDLSSVSISGSVGASNTTSVPDSAPLILGTVSNSQSSSRSNTLTNTSESSGNTVLEDFHKVKSTVAMNIVDAGFSSDCVKTDQKQERPGEGNKNKGKEDQQSDSPKKLNTDTSVTESNPLDKLVTPSRSNICRNSYTLSEPSPALVQAQGRPEAERREKTNEQRTTNSTISNMKQQNVNGQLSPQRMQSTSVQSTGASELHVKMSIPSGAETEGKAEHINKYLNQVQFQNSMSFTGQSWDTRHKSVQEAVEDMEEPDEEGHSVLGGTASDESHMSVIDVLRSIAESHGSLEQLTVEELLDLHQQQMNDKRQTLIRLQQRDMEELFVQQRREVMLLESEIKAAQQQEKEQQKFLIQNAPENIKMKSRTRDGEYSPVQTGNFERADIKHRQHKPVAGNSMNSSEHSQPGGNHSSVTSLKLQQKSYTRTDAEASKSEQIKSKTYIQSRKSNVMFSSPGSTNENQTCVKTISGDPFYFRNTSSTDVRIANRIPELSPSAPSPYTRRSILMRSPLNYTNSHRRNEKLFVPSEAYLPEMQVKFDKITAIAKGFLTRCLIKSDKVQALIKTIKDTREFAFSFQTETPIKKGMFTQQDKVLLERIIAQLQAALLDIHEIFFDIPMTERLALIELTRLSEQDKRAKAASRDNMRESVPKISQATLKALERKRKSRESEASAVESMSRPKTAPPRTSSPHHNSYTDSRALRPLQGHTQISPIRPETKRLEKGFDTIKEKPLITQPKRIVAVPNKSASILFKTNNDSQMKGSVKLSAMTNKPVLKLKPAANKTSSQPLKSWR